MLDEIVQEMTEMILNRETQEGEANGLESRIHRTFLPTWRESLLYQMAGNGNVKEDCQKL